MKGPEKPQAVESGLQGEQTSLSILQDEEVFTSPLLLAALFLLLLFGFFGARLLIRRFGFVAFSQSVVEDLQRSGEVAQRPVRVLVRLQHRSGEALTEVQRLLLSLQSESTHHSKHARTPV